ncbi:hypothetical protein LD39_04385 [Halobacillus sp. BBL2006]|nr:hypothetical protein LD39_04385 [Halobacillus sp. BBL2006]
MFVDFISTLSDFHSTFADSHIPLSDSKKNFVDSFTQLADYTPSFPPWAFTKDYLQRLLLPPRNSLPFPVLEYLLEIGEKCPITEEIVLVNNNYF